MSKLADRARSSLAALIRWFVTIFVTLTIWSQVLPEKQGQWAFFTCLACGLMVFSVLVPKWGVTCRLFGHQWRCVAREHSDGYKMVRSAWECGRCDEHLTREVPIDL